MVSPPPTLLLLLLLPLPALPQAPAIRVQARRLSLLLAGIRQRLEELPRHRRVRLPRDRTRSGQGAATGPRPVRRRNPTKPVSQRRQAVFRQTPARSPKTNVTVADTNNNTPTVTVVNTQRATASNINNDEDTNRVTASNTNSILNQNGRGFAWPDGWHIPSTRSSSCTQTFTVSKYANARRKKFEILD